MPRLVSRSQYSAPGRSAQQEQEGDDDLPPYEKPSCFLTDSAISQLTEISRYGYESKKYDDHIKHSMKSFGQSVAAVNDSLRNQQEALECYEEKKEGSDKPEKKSQKDELAEFSADFAPKVATFNEKAESCMRDLIDRQVELADVTAAASATADGLKALQRQYQQQQQQQQHAASEHTGPKQEGSRDGEGDIDMRDDQPGSRPVPSALEMFERDGSERAQQNRALSMRDRYARNNDYAAFKKLWHDSMHGDDEVPLPDASRWFGENGNPVIIYPKRGHGQAGGSNAEEAKDEDDDLVIAGETLSFVCPLSLQEFTEPYSNQHCSHTFEKSAIVEFIRSSPNSTVQCPQTGCSQVRDFFFNAPHAHALTYSVTYSCV
jgi:E3 SUMO-protein ligase NSE2